ncbi:hypothetical protein Tco_0733644 [Tanacetum coccineum]
MAHYVAPVAFGGTWTIMMIVAFRTQRLGPAVISLLPVPCSVSFTSILPLVRLLLVLIVLSLAFGKSADLFIHTFLKLHYWTLTLEVSQTSTLITGTLMLSLSDSTFSGGGDDEGSVAANSVMHVSADGDCGKQTHQSQMPLYSQLEGTRSSVGTAEGSAEARCSSSSSFSTSSSSLSSSDDLLS